MMRETIDWDRWQRYIEEERPLPEEFYQDMERFALIVFARHFTGVPISEDKQDMLREGVLKAATLAASGGFNSRMGSLKNYIYTGMRNDMGNYLYRNRREVLFDEIFNAEAQPSTFLMEAFQISLELIEEVVGKLGVRYREYVSGVAAYLKEDGWLVKGGPVDPPSIELEPSILEKLVCMTVWRKLES